MTIKCPECYRANTISNTVTKIKCRGCLQYLIIEDGKIKKVIPKDILK